MPSGWPLSVTGISAERVRRRLPLRRTWNWPAYTIIRIRWKQYRLMLRCYACRPVKCPNMRRRCFAKAFQQSIPLTFTPVFMICGNRWMPLPGRPVVSASFPPVGIRVLIPWCVPCFWLWRPAASHTPTSVRAVPWDILLRYSSPDGLC